MEIVNKRDSFVFYRSFADSIGALPERLQLHLFKAITAYALDLKEPTFDDISEGYILKAIWLNVKPQLDANYRRFQNGCKGGKYGVLGGAPNGNQNARKYLIQNNPKTTPNVNDNENVNDNVDVNVNGEFQPPTLQDISSYVSSIGSTINPERFYNHYMAIGWVDKNGNPIKDWKCVVRIWQDSEKLKEKPRNGTKAIDAYGEPRKGIKLADTFNEQPKRVYTIKEIQYAEEHGITDAEAYDILHGIKKS